MHIRIMVCFSRHTALIFCFYCIHPHVDYLGCCQWWQALHRLSASFSCAPIARWLWSAYHLDIWYARHTHRGLVLRVALLISVLLIFVECFWYLNLVASNRCKFICSVTRRLILPECEMRFWFTFCFFFSIKKEKLMWTIYGINAT